MTSNLSKTWSFAVLMALAASPLAGCTGPEGPSPPPVPAPDGKADGPCPYSCEAYHYTAGECLGGWECDAAGTCLSYVGTPDAPESCPSTPPTPPMPPPAVGVQQVATGLDYSCALKLDGTIVCWGDDGNANWDWTGRTHPPSGTFRQIALAEDHACGIRTDGTVACWGGNGAADSVFPPSGTFKELSADTMATCGIRVDGTIACWGSPYEFADNAFAPFAHVSVGDGNGGVVCSLTTSGAVYCNDYADQLSIVSPFPDVLTAISVNGQSREGGSYYECGLRTDGTMMCWEPWALTCDDPDGYQAIRPRARPARARFHRAGRRCSA